MANKENLPPKNIEHSHIIDDRSTPPGNIPATLGIRPWQHTAYKSPPFALLSPNSKPSLARQRDHSACRKTDSPLKVRKTRENLKQASIYGEVPAPCMHGSTHNLGNHAVPPSLSFARATTVSSRGDGVESSGLYPDNDLTGSTLLSSGIGDASASVSAPPPLQTPSKIMRHKSVSRRVLSRVKEGIIQRSRSSHGTGPTEKENRLVRRVSAKRKSSSEGQPRLQGFGISRDSIDSEPDPGNLSATPQRSCTESSIATDELMGTGITLTPPSCFGDGPRTASTDLLSPGLTMGSPYERTPRANHRASARYTPPGSNPFQACLPYIDMKISIDRDAVDVGISKDVWVAVEAVVRTRIIAAPTSFGTRPEVPSRRPLDVIIIICQATLVEYAEEVKHCMVELCSRLDAPADRVSVLLAFSHQVDSSTISCTCIHSMQSPEPSVILARLGLAPCPTQDRPLGASSHQPIQTALTELAAQGLRQDSAHGIILSSSPAPLAQAVEQSTTWPAHLFNIGLHPQSPAVASHKSASWSFDVRYPGDLCTSSLDNMLRDLRQACPLSKITSLRICYKAMDGSHIAEVIGEKAVKDLQLGQRCSLFLKVCLPKIGTAADISSPRDQASLFTELESIVGTLQTNFLHVEARYRHTVLPAENVVTIRQICTMRRPKLESR
ncbi:hypothetical protein Slin14017_G130500 [Septoria linicola]|nr:hypothetical protein Slin14017_G130500 [Septoria linicola]